MERILNNTTIVKNFVQRYLALAHGHFDEVFIKEFVSDDDHKQILLRKGTRAKQKQIVIADVVFGNQALSTECYDALAELAKHTQAFWHDLRCAIHESTTDQEIGMQQPARKASAEAHLRRMTASADALGSLLTQSLAAEVTT